MQHLDCPITGCDYAMFNNTCGSTGCDCAISGCDCAIQSTFNTCATVSHLRLCNTGYILYCILLYHIYAILVHNCAVSMCDFLTTALDFHTSALCDLHNFSLFIEQYPVIVALTLSSSITII